MKRISFLVSFLIITTAWTQDDSAELQELLNIENVDSDKEDQKILENIETVDSDKEDQKILENIETVDSDKEDQKILENIESVDDLEQLEKDLMEEKIAIPSVKESVEEKEEKSKPKGKITIFDTSSEEKDLLELSKFIEDKIPSNEWDSIALSAKTDRYVVQKGDWLWKISKALFGTGFYYPKIWALNQHITNPHNIEPGMILLITGGSEDDLPRVKLGNFREAEEKDVKSEDTLTNLYGVKDRTLPPWLLERKKLKAEGTYFQYSTSETYQDLQEISRGLRNTEYRKYEPSTPEIVVKKSSDNQNIADFDQVKRFQFIPKQELSVTTFVSKSPVQDVGAIIEHQDSHSFVRSFEKIYVQFDPAIEVKPDDYYSAYVAEGKVVHKKSERFGYRYTIVGHIRTIRKINRLWECEVVRVMTPFDSRTAHVTVYTPNLKSITPSYLKRSVEGIILSNYRGSSASTFGDFIYIDRGRADGIELGTVFDFFRFSDVKVSNSLAAEPFELIGEGMVVTLTDNFSTVYVNKANAPINSGDFVRSHIINDALLSKHQQLKNRLGELRKTKDKVMNNLDVELNLDDINKDLLEDAHKVRLTEEEIRELESQERERSVIKRYDDLEELSRLEQEIVDAESLLNQAKINEDKFLEQQNIDDLEKSTLKSTEPDSLASIDDIENEIGTKYLDQKLDIPENPYGLSRFDLERVDELLNK